MWTFSDFNKDCTLNDEYWTCLQLLSRYYKVFFTKSRIVYIIFCYNITISSNAYLILGTVLRKKKSLQQKNINVICSYEYGWYNYFWWFIKAIQIIVIWTNSHLPYNIPGLRLAVQIWIRQTGYESFSYMTSLWEEERIWNFSWKLSVLTSFFSLQNFKEVLSIYDTLCILWKLDKTSWIYSNFYGLSNKLHTVAPDRFLSGCPRSLVHLILQLAIWIYTRLLGLTISWQH